MVMTDCQVFADALAIAWKKTSFQSGTHMLFTYFSNVSFPTSSSTVLYTPFFTATSLTISFAIALASGLPNVHMFESTITNFPHFSRTRHTCPLYLSLFHKQHLFWCVQIDLFTSVLQVGRNRVCTFGF